MYGGGGEENQLLGRNLLECMERVREKDNIWIMELSCKRFASLSSSGTM